MCYARMRLTLVYANLSLDSPLSSCGGETFCSFISTADRTARPTDSDRPSFPGSVGPRAKLNALMAAYAKVEAAMPNRRLLPLRYRAVCRITMSPRKSPVKITLV